MSISREIEQHNEGRDDSATAIEDIIDCDNLFMRTTIYRAEINQQSKKDGGWFMGGSFANQVRRDRSVIRCQ